MTAYLVASIDVTDPEEYQKYASQTQATVEKYGGRYIVKGGDVETLEGTPAARYAIMEFPDAEAVRRWYDSPEYQALKPIRQRASDGALCIVPGV